MRRMIHCAGLAPSAMTALLAVMPRVLGEDWQIEAWNGRMNGELFVTGDGPVAEQARRAAMASLRPVLCVRTSSFASYREHFLARLPRYRDFLAPKRTPFHIARAMGGVAPLVFCGSLDAKTLQHSQDLEHAQHGRIRVDFQRGWISGEVPVTTFVASMFEPWLPRSGSASDSQTMDAADRHCFSLESAIWLGVLRWRSEFEGLDTIPSLRLTDFPDIAAITGQAGLQEAVYAWQTAATVASLTARTSVSADLATAIAAAAALSGQIDVFPVELGDLPPVKGSREALPQARDRPSTFARLAHFLGLNRALGRDFP